MEYLVDKYIKKPEYVRQLLNEKVTVSIKIDGSAFQIFYNKNTNKIEYHKRGGSSNKLGPIIDEYTQLFAKHLNDAIDFFNTKEDILRQYKFYAIEIFNDMYVLLNVIDNNDNTVIDIEDIAKKLDIESLPILLNNSFLSEESKNILINMMTSDINTTNNEFISLLSKAFDISEYGKFLKGDEIEGIVLSWTDTDKPIQYKIINPAFKVRHEAEQKANKEESEKDEEKTNKLIELLYKRLNEVAKYRNENWINNLDLNFLEMISDTNWLDKAKDIAKDINPNKNKWFMLQLDRINNIINQIFIHNDDTLKIIYEKYIMTFNKPKKKAFIISKEFQDNINTVIEEKLKNIYKN